jgi:hypothetical protein
MKRFLMKRGVTLMFTLMLSLGGLFLVNDALAQAPVTQVQTQQQQSWIGSGAALVVVNAEINQLTANYQQMKNAGAEPSALYRVKLELQLYMTIQKALQNGFSTQQAFDLALQSVGLSVGSISTNNPLITPAQSKAIYDRILDKLTD